MNRLPRVLLLSALLPLTPCVAAPPGDPPTLPTTAMKNLLGEISNSHLLVQNGRPVALYGAEIDSGTGTAAALAASFVLNDADALGVDEVDLVYDSEATTGNGRHTVVTYTQEIEDLPVHGSAVKIAVLLGGTKRITYIGIRLVNRPNDPLPSTNERTAAGAIQVVDDSTEYGHLTMPSSAVKMVYEADDKTLHRAYRFRASDDDEAYLFFVDTTAAEAEAIVGVVDQIADAQNRALVGTVSGYATDGTTADGDLLEVDLEGVLVRTVSGFTPSGQQLCPAYDATAHASDYTDSGATYIFELGEAAEDDMATCNLIGQWVSVVDYGGGEETTRAVECDAVPSWISCDDDGDCTTPETCTDNAGCVDDYCNNDSSLSCNANDDCWFCTKTIDLTFNDPSDESGTAQVNAFVTAEATHDWFADLMNSSTKINHQVECRVNADLFFGCNAFYAFESDPPAITCLVSYPGACNNPAFSTVISHEYGHYIVDKVVTPRPTHASSFHEGVADSVAALMWNTDCIAENMFLDPVVCLRNIDAVATTDHNDFCFNGGANCDPTQYTCASDQDFGCEVRLRDLRCREADQKGADFHCTGMALPGAFWDLRELLLDAQPPTGKDTDWKTEELLEAFLQFTDGELDESVLIEMLSADDTDENLVNGTPNGQDILCAFVGENADDCSLPTAYTNGFTCTEKGHGWHCPVIGDGDDGSVKVEWFGPIAPYTSPADPDDFTVNYDVSPPIVTLKTTEKGDPGSEVAVTKWYVGRMHPTTGVPLDLTAVYNDWASSSSDIEVKIGTRSTEPLRNLEVVEITRQTGHYSNIVLALDSGDEVSPANLSGYAQCWDNNGVGGLISGTVTGTANRVRGYGIGSGDASPGQLEVQEMSNLRLATIPTGSTLKAEVLTNHLQIDDKLIGTIDIAGDLETDIRILGTTGDSTGDILIGGDIAESATLGYGVFISGDMSGDIHVSGDILGKIDIDGEFDGDICAKNLTPGMSFPSNITIAEFGANASVCGWTGECADCDDGSSCTTDSCDGIWCDHTDNDSCTGSDVCPPSTPRPPHSATKNRYISFNPTNNDSVAFEIELYALELTSCSSSGAPCRPDKYVCSGDYDEDCDPDENPNPCTSGSCTVAKDCGECSTSGDPCIRDADCGGTETCEITDPPQTCVNDQAQSVGTTWWVGPPDGNDVARAVPFADRHISNNWPTTVHVGDCEIVPAATYRIRASDGTYDSSWLNIDTTDRPGTNHYWADGVGPLFSGTVWQQPDGSINFNDIQAMVFGFQEFGAFPHKTWQDLHGAGSAGAEPDYVINFSDIQFAVLALAGNPYPFCQPANCPCSGDPPGGTAIEISVVPRSEIIQTGADVIVDVFMDSADSLGAYQVKLEVTGGTSGDLVLTNIDVDTGDDDYVFKNESPTTGIHPDGERVGGTLSNGDGMSVSTVGYLATYTYQATGGASGTFTISVVEDDSQTFLNNASGARLAIEAGDSAVVGYGIDCYNDGHCDDSNDCTTDTCTSNECGYTNVSSGTGCDDGLWCTKRGSTCDGNGNCTGGIPRCDPGEICDEQAQQCIEELP